MTTRELFFLLLVFTLANCKQKQTYSYETPPRSEIKNLPHDKPQELQLLEQEQSPRYNQIAQKSSHNSFERLESLSDQILFHKIRSIELDIHTKPPDGNSDIMDWFVYHEKGDSFSSCPLLLDCLNELKSIHFLVPNHEVITVMLDLKDPFDKNHTPESLDEFIAKQMKDILFRPSEMACENSIATLGESINTCMWPQLSKLRGKFIFVVTGGSFCEKESNAKTYYDKLYPNNNFIIRNPVAFAMPNLDNSCQFKKYENQFKSVVFFNIRGNQLAFNPLRQHGSSIENAEEIYQHQYVGRVWGLKSSTFKQALNHHAHHLATDFVNINADPWSDLHDKQTGWPFQCLDNSCVENRFEDDVKGIYLQTQTSGFHKFLYRKSTDLTEFSSFIATEGSHAPSDAMGCLTIKENLEQNSPYIAVCKPAADPYTLFHPSKILSPSHLIKNIKTASGQAPILITRDATGKIHSQKMEGYIKFARFLFHSNEKKESCIDALGAQYNLQDWKKFGSLCLSTENSPLYFGISVYMPPEANSKKPIQFLFVGPTYQEGDKSSKFFESEGEVNWK